MADEKRSAQFAAGLASLNNRSEDDDPNKIFEILKGIEKIARESGATTELEKLLRDSASGLMFRKHGAQNPIGPRPDTIVRDRVILKFASRVRSEHPDFKDNRIAEIIYDRIRSRKIGQITDAKTRERLGKTLFISVRSIRRIISSKSGKLANQA